MILVDTTPLVALCEPRDALHRRALGDLDRLARKGLAVCEPVLTEACFLLGRSVQRARLDRILSELAIRAYRPADEELFRRDVFQWLFRYESHQPDWADGYLVVAAGREKGARVWTYDSEFRTTWRLPGGGRVRLAGGRETG